MEVRPTLLLILDGWGQAGAGPGNAVSLANTPNIDALMQSPRTELACSGRSVGLPEGYMGNSEVGHMNIGAGRVVYQDMTRIDIAIEDGSFDTNPVITGVIESARRSGGRLHLMGLLSDGGVHSHSNHLYALLRLADRAGVRVWVHAFMDGRDTAPDSGLGFMRELTAHLPASASIATVNGRYYAMDRDKRWERVERAWQAIVHGSGRTADDALSAVQASYDASETDEFILPTVVGDYAGMAEKDAVFLFNFRADRIRELATCLDADAFDGFDRGPRPALSGLASMTRYEASLRLPVAFERVSLSNGLGETVSRAGLRQLRIAETEKYAHVTFFFNGGREDPMEGESRILVPSPRDVATYDQKPEMSAPAVTDALIEEWTSGRHDFYVCNLANMDMVGHTGSIPAAVQAVETVDRCVGRIAKAVKNRGGIMLMTADHGNAEEMIAPDGSPQTAHSKNPVAMLVYGLPQGTVRLRQGGKLGDLAPTILSLWNMPVPPEMTGQPLCEVQK